MFTRARIRLTAWYVCGLAAFLLALGAGVYLFERNQLRNNVDHGLLVTSAKAVSDFRNRNIADLTAISDGVRYFVSLSDGTHPAVVTRNLEPNLASVHAALANGTDMRTVSSSAGHLRVYTRRIGPTMTVQVARSLEPEEEALDNLLVIMLAGGAGSLAVAAIGGWFLAGKSLRPMQLAFERQQTFVADASHELRTPLAVIRANAEFIQQGQPQSDEAAEIVSETDRLTALIEAMLALAQGEHDAELGHEQIDLGAVVDGSAESMRPLAAERQVTLDVSAAPDLTVAGNREQLRQLVVILVDNALRYTPRGGRVDVDVARQDGSAVLAVSDTGIGIEQSALDRVFERFYRADEARNRDSGGAGLGLAIARKLVADHGGRIAAHSAPGEGSTFTVSLPLAPQAG
jgi:two-component system, OmpR family, sensor histidine kinase CiaH